MYLIEWDLLLLDSLERLYSHVPSEAIAVTARFLLKEVEHEWGWTTREPYKSQWGELLTVVEKKYDYKNEPFASLGPGTCYSRSFIEQYSGVDVPEIACDEQRVPLFAHCFGIPVFDTNFRKTWNDRDDLQYFNCQNYEIPPNAIRAELARADGRRAFHPFRQLYEAGRPISGSDFLATKG